MKADAERFEELFAGHARDVLGYALRRCPDREDAADLVAEVFAVAWRRIRDVPAGDAARPWLFGVARRIMLSVWRAHRRRDNISARLAAFLIEQEVADPAIAVEQRGAALEVVRALDRLRADDRELLMLTAWEELSNAQAAAALGITAAAARVRLHRARVRLRRILDADAPNSQLTKLTVVREKSS